MWGRRISIYCIVAISSLALLCVGCGKKGDPRYPEQRYPVKVEDLAVFSDGGKIILKWTIPGEWDRGGYARIFRSALKTNGGQCPDCPRIYTVLAYLPLRDTRSEGETFTYVDPHVRPGFFYSYRLVVCTSSGNCGERSNTAAIEIP